MNNYGLLYLINKAAGLQNRGLMGGLAKGYNYLTGGHNDISNANGYNYFTGEMGDSSDMLKDTINSAMQRMGQWRGWNAQGTHQSPVNKNNNFNTVYNR